MHLSVIASAFDTDVTVGIEGDKRYDRRCEECAIQEKRNTKFVLAINVFNYDGGTYKSKLLKCSPC